MTKDDVLNICREYNIPVKSVERWISSGRSDLVTIGASTSNTRMWSGDPGAFSITVTDWANSAVSSLLLGDFFGIYYPAAGSANTYEIDLYLVSSLIWKDIESIPPVLNTFNNLLFSHRNETMQQGTSFPRQTLGWKKGLAFGAAGYWVTGAGGSMSGYVYFDFDGFRIRF